MRFVSKEQLKKELPLAYVVGEYGVQLDPDTCTAVCPFHRDERPSFRLYIADDGVERWHCFPCQEGGDVYDFLMRIDPGRCPAFPEALNRAEELFHTLPRGWRDDPDRPKPQSGYGSEQTESLKAKWPIFIGHTNDRASKDPHFAVTAGLLRHDERDDLSLQRATLRLVKRWKWGIDDSSVITVPHYAPGDAEQPTGVKLRASGASGSRKWALPGSKYPWLYGSWLAPEHNYVLITEGESDAVWADLQTETGKLCDVRALPSGASFWDDAWAPVLLATWERIFICLDPDAAGVTATRRMVESLAAAGATVDQIWLCSLPQGRDLRDARPDIRVLLNEAVLPPEDRATIDVTNKRFERLMQTQQGPASKVLCSWYFDPVARLRPNAADGLNAAYEAEVYVRGAVYPATVTAEDLGGKGRFQNWCGKEGLASVANDNDILELSAWMEARAAVTPEKYQTRRIGIHPPPERYHWAGSTLVLPRDRGPSGQGYMGNLPWVWRGMPEHESSVFFHPDDKQPADYRWLTQFLALSKPGFTEPLLGWLCATVRRPELTYFPICSITGSSGSGKSTISRLALKLMGSQFYGSLSGDTPMKLQVLCSSSTSLPVFVDEWTRISRATSLETMKAIITYIYEGGSTEKYSSGARIDRDVYTFTSPVLLAGEMEFTQTREVERMIPLSLRRSDQDPNALRALIDQPLERFAWHFNEWFIRIQREDPASLPALPSADGQGRAQYNWAVVQHGWDLLKLFLETEVKPNLFDHTGLPELGDVPRRDAVEQAFADIKGHNAYDDAISAAVSIRDQRFGTAVEVEEGRGTWVNARVVCKIARELQIDLPGGERAMLEYLRETCVRNGFSEELLAKRRYDPITGSYTLMKLLPGYFPEGWDDTHDDARATWRPSV